MKSDKRVVVSAKISTTMKNELDRMIDGKTYVTRNDVIEDALVKFLDSHRKELNAGGQ